MLCATCCTETYARGLHSPLRSGCLATLSLTSFHNFHSASHKECREERRCGTELFSTHTPNQSCSVSTLFRVLTAFHGRPHGRCTACAPSQSTIWLLYWPNSTGTLFGKHLLSIASSTGGTPSRVNGDDQNRTGDFLLARQARYRCVTSPRPVCTGACWFHLAFLFRSPLKQAKSRLS